MGSSFSGGMTAPRQVDDAPVGDDPAAQLDRIDQLERYVESALSDTGMVQPRVSNTIVETQQASCQQLARMLRHLASRVEALKLPTVRQPNHAVPSVDVPLVDEPQSLVREVLDNLCDVQQHVTYQELMDEVSQVGKWAYDLETRTFSCCGLTRRFFQLAADEPLTIRRIINRFRGDVRILLKEFIEQLLKQHRPLDFQLPICRPDGSEVWVRTIARAICEGGRLRRVIGVVKDVTAYSALSEAALASERRQRLIAECASLGTWDWDLSTGKVDRNARWFEMLGYDADEADDGQMVWENFVHPEDLPEVQRLLDEHFRDGKKSFHAVQRLRHRSGEWIWVTSSGRVYQRGSAGEPLKMAGVHLDITAQRRREQEALKLQKQNELIVDTSLNGVITLDAAYCITCWNRRAEQIFGYTRTEALGRPFYSLLFRETEGNVVTRFGCNQESKAFNKDDKEIPIEFSITPLSVDGELSFVVVLSDLTDRHEQLRHQKFESIGLLAAGIAHEINTPMQFICDNLDYLRTATERLIGFAERLSTATQADAAPANEDLLGSISSELASIKFPRLKENIPAAFADVNKGTSRVTEIVSAMREYSHPGQSGDLAADVNQCVHSTVTICRNRVKYVADVQFDLADKLPPIRCHATELSQVLLNLIVNASDAVAERYGSKRQGEIMIRTERGHDGVVITVRDNGTGMPEKVRRHMFDPFFTTKPVGVGTGQGLTFCYNIVVKNCGGRIKVDSTEGVGTEFTLWFPLVDPPFPSIPSCSIGLLDASDNIG